MNILLVSLWFQGLWLLAVVGREATLWGLCMLLSATLVLTWRKYSLPVKPLLLVLVAGIAMDSLNQWAGILAFPTSHLPLWLAMLWVAFVWYLFSVRDWLGCFSSSLIIAAATVGGPVSYFAGFRLQAVEWPWGVQITMMVLALEWFLLSSGVTSILKNQRGQ